MNINFYRSLIIFIGLSTSILAQKIPQGTQNVLDKLEQYEKRETKKTEQAIIDKYKKLIKSANKVKLSIKNKKFQVLYGSEILAFEKKIKQSMELISNKNLKSNRNKPLVIYGKIYHYNHPWESHSRQKGELTFYEDGHVRLVHKNQKGRRVFTQSNRWEIRDGKFVILDQSHGLMIVTRKNRSKADRLNIKWVRLNKTIDAKIKK